MKKSYLLGMMMILGLMLAAIPMQADLIQCPDGACIGTVNNDVMNGTPGMNAIDGAEGDDIIFGGDGLDIIDGEEGNDVIFGGGASEELKGGDGDDVIMGGPDDALNIQVLQGNLGNDVFNVFVGETINCLLINDGDIGGLDTVNLIGFGPYSADHPYGMPGVGDRFILLQDPVANGFIFIHFQDPVVDGTTQRINGLTSPNLTILDAGQAEDFADANCIQTL